MAATSSGVGNAPSCAVTSPGARRVSRKAAEDEHATSTRAKITRRTRNAHISRRDCRGNDDGLHGRDPKSSRFRTREPRHIVRSHQRKMELMPGTDGASPAHGSVKLTYDDFVLFPDDGQRHELIDGEHYVTACPNTKHQQILLNLSALMHTW